jgi:hypothetical protein
VVACGYKALQQTVDEVGEDDKNIEALKRFNASLKQAAAYNLKAVAESKESPYTAELLRLFNASLLRAAEDNLIKAGFNPAQQRDPAGASTGGQWSGAGGGSGQPLPTRRPSMPDEPGLGHPLSPLDFIGGGGVVRVLRPVASEIVGGATAARNAIRLRGYLNEARKIPKGVVEMGKGRASLTKEQFSKLTDWGKSNRNYKPDIQVTNFSDGSSIFSFKVPARDIPSSYAVWEKRVSAGGKTINVSKTSIGPKGELIHNKPK